MTAQTHDIVTVGGGLAGAGLAQAMAAKGVLVLERETRFKDRVRGEAMTPWGVAEAQALGIYDLLLATCAHQLPWWDKSQTAFRTSSSPALTASPWTRPLGSAASAKISGLRR